MGTLTTMPTADPSEPTERGRRRRYNRVVAFGLSGEEWDVLVDLAVSESRDPFQQARWVVLQAIRGYTEERAS